MNWLKQIFSRRRHYAELSEEIREHLEERVEDLVARGVSREEAEHAARREFGNITLAEEDSREAWRWPAAEDFAGDVRDALRTRAAYVYITDAAGPMPWGRLPSYWADEVAEAAAVSRAPAP